MTTVTPIHQLRRIDDVADFAIDRLEERSGFSAAALKRDGHTYDQLSGAISAADLKADALSPEIKRALRRVQNPNAKPYDLKLARDEIARAQRFNNQLGEMLAVIAGELAERTA